MLDVLGTSVPRFFLFFIFFIDLKAAVFTVMTVSICPHQITAVRIAVLNSF